MNEVAQGVAEDQEEGSEDGAQGRTDLDVADAATSLGGREDLGGGDARQEDPAEAEGEHEGAHEKQRDMAGCGGDARQQVSRGAAQVRAGEDLLAAQRVHEAAEDERAGGGGDGEEGYEGAGMTEVAGELDEGGASRPDDHCGARPCQCVGGGQGGEGASDDGVHSGGEQGARKKACDKVCRSPGAPVHRHTFEQWPIALF
jgi:hypothetical protein